VNILAKDLRSWGFRRWALVLLTIVAATPTRVVTMASTILLVPLTRVKDVTRVIVVADTVMDGWGFVPHFVLFWVDRSFLLAWH
jgi:hypothetical protein